MDRSELEKEIVLLLTFASKDLGGGNRLISEFNFNIYAQDILDKVLSNDIERDNQIALRKIEEFTSNYPQWQDMNIGELVDWLKKEEE